MTDGECLMCCGRRSTRFCQWNALNGTDLCSSSSAHRRFLEWTEAGVFQNFWTKALEGYDEFVGLDWSWMSMDGAMTKAPLGGKKNGTESHGPGEARDQAQPAHGGAGHPRRRRRGEPQRLQDNARHDRGARDPKTASDAG